jgi:hypothetical protein
VQILIKARSRPRLRELVDLALEDAVGKGLDPRSVKLEIDPINMM